MELNTLMKRLDVKKTLTDQIKEVWGDSGRFVKYRKNKGIINYAKFDIILKDYLRLDEVHKKFGDDGMTRQDLQKYEQLMNRFFDYRYVVHNGDMLEVSRVYASQITVIAKCEEEMTRGVVKYEKCLVFINRGLYI